MHRLCIVGDMCLSRDEILGPSNINPDWVTVDYWEDPNAIFVAYNQLPPRPVPTSVRVIGTNMSRPSWYTSVPVVTTRDIPRSVLEKVTSTAEHALGLALALHRNLVPASSALLADRTKFMAPKMLSQMTAGIIGMGRIGNMLARYLKPLMKDVDWWDPAGLGDLDGVLQKSDIFFLCCPSSPFGHPMGIAEFNKMPRGALIVNIAQPDLLNWREALNAVFKGDLRGIASDVYPEWVAHDWYDNCQQKSRVLLTPHIAGSTLDARKITEKAVLDVMRGRLNA